MSDATTTDLYEVTMALSCLREGMTGPATFSLFARDLSSRRPTPPGRCWRRYPGRATHRHPAHARRVPGRMHDGPRPAAAAARRIRSIRWPSGWRR
ncbi:hypothetical protein GCM10020256_02090 [Streptomyces thermocoprophilus]